MKAIRGGPATVMRQPTQVGNHQGYDKTAGHHAVCTCRPCRKKREKKS